MCAVPLSSFAYETLPPPADAEQARTGFARWEEAASETTDAALSTFMRDLVQDTAGRRLLAALFGNSPFLTHCSLREPALLMRLTRHGPDATFAELDDLLNHHIEPALDQAHLMQKLRIIKRRAAFLVAVADIAGWWSLDRVTRALSTIAEAALGA